MQKYELRPNDGRKSFYGKAIVEVYEDGSQVLRSYNTPVLYVARNGDMRRLWGGWSATTGRHLRAFVGIDKKTWDSMPLYKAELRAHRPNGTATTWVYTTEYVLAK